MADSIGSLSVDVSANVASLYTGLTQAADRVARFGQETKQSLDGIGDRVNAVGNAFRTLAGLTVAGLGVHQFTAFIEGAIEAQAQLQDLADKVGTTASALSSLVPAAKLSGTGMEEVSQASGRFSKSLIDVQSGTGKAAEAFKTLGFSAADAARFLKDPTQGLFELGKRLNEFQTDGNKTAVVLDLLGKSGQNLIPFLKQLGEQTELTTRVTDAQALAAKQLQDQWYTLQLRSDDLKNAIASGIVPELSRLLTQFTETTGAAGGFRDAVKDVAGDGTLAIWMVEAARAAAVLGESIFAIIKVFAAFGGSVNVIIADIKATVAAMALAVGGSRADFDKAIEERNATLADSNERYRNLWSDRLTVVSDALGKELAVLRGSRAAFLKETGDLADIPGQSGPAITAKPSINTTGIGSGGTGKVDAYAAALQSVRQMAAEATAALASLEAGTGKLTAAQTALAKLQSSDVWKTFSATQRTALETMYDGVSATQKAIDVQTRFSAVLAKISQQENGFSKNWEDDFRALTDAFNGGLIKLEEYRSLTQKLLDQQPFAKKQTEAIKEEMAALQKLDDAMRDSHLQDADAFLAFTRSLKEQNEDIAFQTSLIGRTSEEQERLTALHKIDIDVQKELAGLSIAATQADRDRIVAAGDVAKQNISAAIATKQSLDAQSRGWTELFNSIADRGSKFIEDFVQHGSSAFKNLWNDFKSWALQALARIAAQQVIVSIVGAVGGTGSTIANAASSLTGGNSGSSIISTLLQKGGSLFGNSVGSVPTTAAGLGTGSFDYGAGASGADLGGGSLPSSGISNMISNAYGSIMSGAGSMLFGVGSAGAVAMGAGFSAGISTLGIAASAGTAAVGGMGAAMGALGAVAIPVVGWIIAAVALLKAAGVFDHGGPKIGGSATNIPDYGSFFPGEETDTGNKLAQAVVDGTQQSFQAALRSLGGKGTAGFAFGYDTDPEGTADARVSAGAVVNGQSVFTQRDVGAGKDATSAQAALQLEAERALLAALKASDLPTYLASLFDGLDAATASADDITKVIATAQAIRTVAEAIPDLAAQFEKMDAGQINALVDAFGGLAEFTKSAGFIAANFTTSAEKYAKAQTDLTNGFADLGLAVPKTHQAFLDLLGSCDLTTVAGQHMYASISQLAPLFVDVAGTAEQAADALKNQIKSATDFFAENFFSDAEKNAVKLAADTATLAKAQHDLGIEIPTSITGFRDFILSIDRTTEAGEALYQKLIVLSPAIYDLATAADTATTAIVNATNAIATSVGGIINQAAGLANTLLGQFSTLADASPGDFGAKLGIQLNLIADSIKNADVSQFSSQLGFDTYVGTLQGAAGVLADQLARFTILSAQYDAARAEQLVSLQDWYFAQELIFSRTNNTAALDALRTIFDQKWDAIVSGSQAAVSSLDDFIKKIQDLANATGGNAGQQAGIELALSSAKVSSLQSQYAGLDPTTVLAQSIQAQIGKLQTYNASLATQIAHFTIYTAQFGKATASQLVDLENWYADQQTAFTGNTDALAILGDIFNDKWKAIIDGTNSGVNGTIDAMQRIADYLKGLFVGDLSPLTPLQKIATAKQAYEAELAKAQGGDVGALGDVTKFADVFLNLQRQFSASSPAYTDVFNKVTSDLGTLAGTLPNGQPIPTTPADVNAALVNALPPSGISSSDDIKAVRELLARLIEELANANTADSIAEREALQAAAREIAAAVSGPELP